jgi:hypothetical protein
MRDAVRGMRYAVPDDAYRMPDSIWKFYKGTEMKLRFYEGTVVRCNNRITPGMQRSVDLKSACAHVTSGALIDLAVKWSLACLCARSRSVPLAVTPPGYVTSVPSPLN